MALLLKPATGVTMLYTLGVTIIILHYKPKTRLGHSTIVIANNYKLYSYGYQDGLPQVHNSDEKRFE